MKVSACESSKGLVLNIFLSDMKYFARKVRSQKSFFYGFYYVALFFYNFAKMITKIVLYILSE